MPATEPREVYGRLGHGFVMKYRVQIRPARSFWRDGWQYVLYEYWTSWNPAMTSAWFANREDCERAANALLDEIAASDEGEWLAAREEAPK